MTIERRQSDAIDTLHSAVQAFSNSLADTQDDVGARHPRARRLGRSQLR